MKPFADLLDNLTHAPGQDRKQRLLVDYFARTPDPDRGWALAVLTGAVQLPRAKPATLRTLAEARLNSRLFALSQDYVGDLAETLSLIWPDKRGNAQSPHLSDVVDILRSCSAKEVPSRIEAWMDNLSIAERYVLLKFLIGGSRAGVSGNLIRTALAVYGSKPLAEIETLWFGLQPPYTDLFAWLTDAADRPVVDTTLAYRPAMRAQTITEGDLDKLSAADFTAEWKWAGLRVLLVSNAQDTRLYSRSGDDLSDLFPEFIDTAPLNAVIDGELLILRDGAPAPFGDLQKRINRKHVSKALLAEYPAHLRAYDILLEGAEDLRALHFSERRRRLEQWQARYRPTRIDLSPLIPFEDWSTLVNLRATTRNKGTDGMVLKRHASPYVAGRPPDMWFKWQQDPLVATCVLMYAERGAGNQSSYYSNFTFGCWRPAVSGEEELVPVGKSGTGISDDELQEIDTWVRAHETEKFGPVRAVEPSLVFEIAFESVEASTRHKSGLTLRAPRIHRILRELSATESDRIETLRSMIQ